MLRRMGSPASVPRPARVLISYAPADEAHATELEKHLSALKREGLIEPWSKAKLSPGQHIDEALKQALNEASLVLVLVSADYVAAESSWKGELEPALARRAAGKLQVVPIRIRPVDLGATLLAKLAGLPSGDQAVTQWQDKDSAWADVAAGLRAMLVPRTTRTHSAGGEPKRGGGEPQSAGEELQAKVEVQKGSAALDGGAKPSAVAKPDRGEEREPPPPESESRSSSPRWLLPVGLALGVAGLMAVVIVSLSIPPNPGPMLHIALRTVLALSAAAFGLALTGALIVRMPLPYRGSVIGGGTFAIFLIVYFFAPAVLPPAPPPVEASPQVPVLTTPPPNPTVPPPVLPPPGCGNGQGDGTEECDDGNAKAGDGCSGECRVEKGFACKGWPSQCERTARPGPTKPAESAKNPASIVLGASCTPGTVKMEFHSGREGACGVPPPGTRTGPDGVIWWQAGSELGVPLQCSCKANQ